jgi:tryptophan synthase alpha chain
MSRLAQAFARARAENRAAFVAYLCAGDPDFDTSLAACRTLLANGVDVLELGVPFSDPLADGLTNQLAAPPIVFYTYYNLVFTNGVENYVRTAKAAGLDALLTLDLPPEEADELVTACRTHGLGTVFIVAPTTPEARLARICGAASGFIYYVSREGVTGVRAQVAANIPEAVARIRAHTGLPVAVGFGISTRAQVTEVAAHADGVVVGSALVNCISRNLGSPEQITRSLAEVCSDLAIGVKRLSSSGHA